MKSPRLSQIYICVHFGLFSSLNFYQTSIKKLNHIFRLKLLSVIQEMQVCVQNQIEEWFISPKTLSILQSNQEEEISQHKLTMSTHTNHPFKKPSLLPSKSCINNFIFNISQAKRNQKQQTQNMPSKPKIHIKDTKHTISTQEKENSTLQIIRSPQSHLVTNIKTPFSIYSVEQHILGSANKSDRKKYVYNIYRGVIYSQLKLKPPSEQLVRSKTVFLSQPTVSHKKFLILDLDETLIHAQRSSDEGNKSCYRFAYRPHLFPFLQRMGELFEVYLFTAAHKSYAEALMKKLNRRNMLIKDFLHRQHCLQTKKGRFLKDLRIIGNRNLQDIVIIDNLVESFGLQINNGIPIFDFNGSNDDTELLKLIPLMERLSEAQDVRSVLKEVYRLEEVGNLDRGEVQAYFSGSQ